MKRTLILLLVLLIGTSSIYAEDIGAQVSVGGNLSFLSTEGWIDLALSERSPRLGLSVGVSGNYHLHAMEDTVNLSVQPGILYTMKGFRLDAVKVNLDYIEIPVLVKAQISLEDFVDPYLLAGPSVGFNVVREGSAGSYTLNSDDKRADFGIIVGVGVDLERDIAVDIRANFGLVDIIEGDTRNQNHSVALMVTYMFL